LVDFFTGVWFYDTRSQVTRTYRITSVGGQPNLELVHTTPENTGAKIGRYAVGLLLSAAAVLGVRWVWRHRRELASD
jgi:hypothetical protein